MIEVTLKSSSLFCPQVLVAYGLQKLLLQALNYLQA